MSHEEQVHEHRQLGGYKATLHNPNASDEAKAHAAEVLVESGQTLSEEDQKHHDHFHQHQHEIVHANPLGVSAKDKDELKKAEEHEKHVTAGFKSVLNNPNASEQAKEHAQEVLEASK